MAGGHGLQWCFQCQRGTTTIRKTSISRSGHLQHRQDRVARLIKIGIEYTSQSNENKIKMDAPQDEAMTENIEETETRLPLSDDEQRALELYDRLQELRLEIAIINAQQKLSHHAGKPTRYFPNWYRIRAYTNHRHCRGHDRRGSRRSAQRPPRDQGKVPPEKPSHRVRLIGQPHPQGGAQWHGGDASRTVCSSPPTTPLVSPPRKSKKTS